MSESAGMSQQPGAHPAETLSNRLDELNRQIVSSMETAVQEFHRDLSDLADQAGTAGKQKAANALLDAFARIDEEDSQSAVLIALLEEGRRFASRTAFFLLQPSQVVVWGSRGFGDGDNTVAGQTLRHGELWTDLVEGGGCLSLGHEGCEEICQQLNTDVAQGALLIPFVIRGQLGGALYADQVGEDGTLLVEALQLLTHNASQAVELVAFRNRGASPALRSGQAGGSAHKLPVWQPDAAAETVEPQAALDAHDSRIHDDAPDAASLETSEEPSEAADEPSAVDDSIAATSHGIDESPAHEIAPAADEATEAHAESFEQAGGDALPDASYAASVTDTDAGADASETAASPAVAPEPALDDFAVATEAAEPTFAEPEPIVAEPTFAEPEPVSEPEPVVEAEVAPTFAEPEPIAPAFAEPPAVTPDLSSDTFTASSAPAFDADEPTTMDLTNETIPEPELEDTSTDIWSLEEDDDDDEPTVVGQAVDPTAIQTPEPEPNTFAEPPAIEPAAPAMPLDNVGQETVRLDIAALQGQAASYAAAPPAAEAATPELPTPAPAAAPIETSFSQPETAYVPPPAFAAPEPVEEAPAPAAPPSFSDPASSGGFVPPPPEPKAETSSGSNEVRPPEDHQGPGLAFASATDSDDALHEEARRLARLLVSEIKLYNEEVIEEGKRNGDIYERLKDDIDRSKQMYQERIDPKLQGKDDYFYQELVQRLAGGDASLLGMP